MKRQIAQNKTRCFIALSFVLPFLAIVYAGFALSDEFDLHKKIKKDIQKCGGELREKACVVEGEDNWLFLQESLVNLLVDWKPNTKQIIAFKDSLEERDIELVVVPVPDKLQTAAEFYSGNARRGITARYYEDWLDELRENDVTVIDALDEFREQSETTPMFEKNESHCTSEARQLLASMVADSLEPIFEDSPKKQYGLRDTIVPGTGNLYHMLHNEYPKYDIKEKKVVTADGKKYHGSKKAPIVVIGDSNTSQGSNNSSNIGAYIAQATGEETFTISKIGGGNIGPTLFKNRDSFLKGKKAVVWVFDGRELYGEFAEPVF